MVPWSCVDEVTRYERLNSVCCCGTDDGIMLTYHYCPPSLSSADQPIGLRSPALAINRQLRNRRGGLRKLPMSGTCAPGTVTSYRGRVSNTSPPTGCLAGLRSLVYFLVVQCYLHTQRIASPCVNQHRAQPCKAVSPPQKPAWLRKAYKSIWQAL